MGSNCAQKFAFKYPNTCFSSSIGHILAQKHTAGRFFGTPGAQSTKVVR